MKLFLYTLYSLYIWVGITYTLTYNGTIMQRGYSSMNGLARLSIAIAWPACLTYDITKFLVNENYPTITTNE